MRRLTVVIGRGWAEVAGYKARELLVEVGSRPVWLPRRRAWSCAPQYARDAICRAEDLGYVVEVVEAEPEPVRAAEPVPLAEAVAEVAVDLFAEWGGRGEC